MQRPESSDTEPGFPTEAGSPKSKGAVRGCHHSVSVSAVRGDHGLNHKRGTDTRPASGELRAGEEGRVGVRESPEQIQRRLRAPTASGPRRAPADLCRPRCRDSARGARGRRAPSPPSARSPAGRACLGHVAPRPRPRLRPRGEGGETPGGKGRRGGAGRGGAARRGGRSARDSLRGGGPGLPVSSPPVAGPPRPPVLTTSR